ncbi:M56 family metallopeptidase [Pseudoalteromonas aurantia]|uniref:Protein TonB n=1 Tax=Pseudoalteromonas aurantia 208 TaxID=1314867 RepID=A0ABR9E6R2_9GAMM|nr:M56 family metallopeptidase [Pseudoalteromonas aurantia]MBE0366669.1 hypothetical protein [Pseudoalteromonas aurantia 208]
MFDILINWVFEVQLLLSLIVLGLIFCERITLHKLGARFIYLQWWILPCALILISIPNELKPLTYGPMQYISVSNPLPHVETWVFSWSLVYLLGFTLFIFTMLWQHLRFHQQLALQPCNLNHRDSITYTSAQIASPMVIGLIHPKIVLPRDYEQQFEETALSLMLEHEHTHITRYDNIWNLCFYSFCALNWFNPLIWCGYHSFRRIQELACDEKVLKNKSHHQQIHYAKALISCIESDKKQHFAYAHYGDKNTMLQRLNYLKNTSGSSRTAKLLLLTCAFTSIGAVALNSTTKTENATSKLIVKPIMRVEPKYPAEAANDGISGYVQLAYTVDERGHTNNIKVIAAQPENTFENNAILALRQWQYTSSNTPSQVYRVQLDFKLDNLAVNAPKQTQFERIDVTN